MSHAFNELRLGIARLAAELMYERLESQFLHAKRKAARMMGLGDHRRQMPSNVQVHEMIEELANLTEGESRYAELPLMRTSALWLMGKLSDLSPRLVGSVLSGRVRQGSDVDILLFADESRTLFAALRAAGLDYEAEGGRLPRKGEARPWERVRVYDRYVHDLIVYESDLDHADLRDPITGRPLERASAARLDRMIRDADPGFDLDAALRGVEEGVWPDGWSGHPEEPARESA
jgi:hypothetical protein